MGELANQLRNEPPKPYNSFRVDEILAILDDEDKAGLLAVLADKSVTVAAITRVLRRNGHPLSENSIRNYRKVHYGLG